MIKVKEQKRTVYFEGIGGRKTSTARVRLIPKSSGILVNGKDYKEYFKYLKHQDAILAPLNILNLKTDENFGVSVKVKGGGLTGQAEAVRHGLARALVKFNKEFSKRLRKCGYLTRDARMVERKKYGLKKARRAPQWAKR